MGRLALLSIESGSLASSPGLRATAHSRRLSFIRSVREQALDLQSATERELRERTDDLRSLVQGRPRRDVTPLRERLFALVVEALRRALGVTLYDVQLLAGDVLAAGSVAEMQTGEGKTFAIALPAAWQALHGRGVHVVTANSYLAGRDAELLRPAYECLGLSVGLLPEGSNTAAKRQAYACDVTYGSGYEFGFDFLRDQLARGAAAAAPLGAGFLRRLRDAVAGTEVQLVQRGLAHAIVDEIDNVLLDDACSPLVIAGPAADLAPDTLAHEAARTLAATLRVDDDFLWNAQRGQVSLTSAGRERIHAVGVEVPLAVLQRPWAEYVRQALQAQHGLQRDVHYVVSGDKVQIVDGSTGRIFADRTWQDGLHQAIEAKERLPIRAECRALAGITRQRFYRLYRHLSGLTGTAHGAEAEFRAVYGLPVVPVPLHRPSQLRELPTRAFGSQDAAFAAATSSIESLTQLHRPVLVGTQSIQSSERLSSLLRDRGVAHQLLNGRQDAEEAALVAAAGQPGMVTISTNIAGRGTDIRLHPLAAAAGGLHVIALGRHRAQRIDRQLIGRCARQGAPGSAECLIAADDVLLGDHAEWLSRRLRDRAGPDGAVAGDISSVVDRVQRRVERQDGAARRRLLELDLNRESMLASLE